MLEFPFFPYQSRLYTPVELFRGFDLGNPESITTTPDFGIYRFFVKSGRGEPRDVVAAAEAIHDCGITNAAKQLLASQTNVVAIMGGHGLGRDHPTYAAVATLAKEL